MTVAFIGAHDLINRRNLAVLHVTTVLFVTTHTRGPKMQDKKTGRELSDEATRLLKQAGFTWTGTKKKSEDYLQGAFERRMVKTGFRGASRAAR